VTPALIVELKKALPSDRVLTDPVDCFAYAYDNSRRVCPPDGVIFPLNIDEIQRVVELCNHHGVPLTPRGRGTGTSGGSLPERGGIALSLERMTRIVSIDPENRVIVAEPGVINQSLQDAVKPFGYFWPPDPSSAGFSTVGGNLATSAGGPHAVKYGTTRDHVLGLKAVTGGGEIIRTGCYTTKGVVGYDLTRLLVGSEGTLAVIAEATLKLTPLPGFVGGVTAYYGDLKSCTEAIVAIMALGQTPSALEFLDSGSLDLIRSRFSDIVPPGSQAMLMIEADGTERDVAETCAAILSACRNEGLIIGGITENPAVLWRARKTLSPLLRDIAPKKINEDVVVPVSMLPHFLEEVSRLSREFQVANVNFGHAGNGNIHVNLLVNPDVPEEMRRAEQCLEKIFDLVIQLRGTLSGEHGVGSEKRAFVGKEIDSVTMKLMKDIKRVFDPGNILNPGKMFP
jgi:D-lactate dehydrogenase